MTEFVHELIRARAQAYPGRAAVVTESGDQVSYGELMARSAALAGRLRSLGVGPDQRVAVLLRRSADLITAMLATLEAGGCYMPIDTSFPAARVEATVRDFGGLVIIGEPDHRDPDGSPSVLPVVASAGHGSAGHGSAESLQHPANPAPLRPGNLAYVLLTSGSSGRPKAVAMSHRGLTRLISWQAESGPPALRTLQFTDTGFDVSLQEVLSTLSTGGTLVLVGDEARRNPELLLARLRDQAVERLFLPYFALHQLAKAAQRERTAPSTLRHVITAGEALIVTDAIADFFGRLPDCRLDNHYGPTEAHLVTSFTLPKDHLTWPSRPPIGTPVADVSTYLLDSKLAPVTDGETGELFIGGGGVARCYLNDPARTAELFLPDPFSGMPGARMYRSGDLAHRGPDHLLEFEGRADRQLKVRGFRVEPAEVELALMSHSSVRSAAVGMADLGPGVTGLVAYLVSDGPAPTMSELAAHVRAMLPAYMVPSRFVFLDHLPSTSSDKLDYRALSQLPVPAGPDGPADASLTGTIGEIWQRVLGHDEFTDDDDFFEVGGDSLLAAWVVAELEQAFGRPVPLSAFLDDPTTAGLAEALRSSGVRHLAAVHESQTVTLRPGPSQRALYLLHPLGGEVVAYRELAHAMKAPLRVLGIQWHGARDGQQLSLEELAAIHLTQLRAVQPDGPYLLAGWSFGGVLAYELAQQLMASGQQVDFLGLLDANPVRDPLTGMLTSDTTHLEFLTQVIDRISTLPADDESGQRYTSWLAAQESWVRLMGVIPDGVDISYLRRILTTSQSMMQAAMKYRPSPYSGPLTLFQAAAAPPGVQEALLSAMRGLALGELSVHPLTGDHRGILRAPCVAASAAAMDLALRSTR